MCPCKLRVFHTAAGNAQAKVWVGGVLEKGRRRPAVSGVKQKECLPGPALVRTQVGTDLSPPPSLFPSVSFLSWKAEGVPYG